MRACRRVGVIGCFLSSGVRRVHGKKSVVRCFFLASRSCTGLPLESIRPLGSIRAPYGPDTLSMRACVHACVHASVRACVRCFRLSYTHRDRDTTAAAIATGTVSAATTATTAAALWEYHCPHHCHLRHRCRQRFSRQDTGQDAGGLVIHADACSLPCSAWTLSAR